MKLINTKNIPDFPDHIKLGYSEIMPDLDTQILSPEELNEWQGFKNDIRKNEYLTARYLFKFMLKRHDIIVNYSLKKDELGKPFGVNGNNYLNVNFSHSSKFVMCAISEEIELGIDIEKLDRDIKASVINRVLNEEEKADIGDENPVLIWTLKEAAVKRLGTGMRTNLNEITINKIGDGTFVAKYKDSKRFNIKSFQFINHQVSVAY